MATRFILTVAIFLLAIWTCYAMSGIIWHKQLQEFVQLFSIPQFAALQEENLAKRRAIVMQDMKGVVVKTVYYENKYRGLIGEPFARVRFIDSAEEMHSRICNDMKEYALFEMDDRFMALNRNGCPLEVIGNFNETRITLALKKNYRYKKTLNSILIKLREVGLLDGIRDHFLSTKVDNVNRKMFKMIDFSQVLLIFLVLGYGSIPCDNKSSYRQGNEQFSRKKGTYLSFKS